MTYTLYGDSFAIKDNSMNIYRIILCKYIPSELQALSDSFFAVQKHVPFETCKSFRYAGDYLSKSSDPSILISGSKFLNTDITLSDIAKKAKEFNPDNIVIGLTSLISKQSLCDGLFNPEEFSVEQIGEENCKLLCSIRVEPGLYPLMRAMSADLKKINKEDFIKLLQRPIDWCEVPSWVEEIKKRPR